MNDPRSKKESDQAATARLTALWALSEAALGGALHALRLPLTGLFVGGSAVLLVTMIAWVARRRGQSPARAVLRATAVVLAVKAVASPHSPPGAYVAVAFQGAAGALFFSLLPGLRAPALALGAVALVESAVQKLLMLALFFGVPLVEATDALGARVLTALGIEGATVSLSLWLAAGYVGAYLAAGLGIGYVASRLPGRARAALRELRATRNAHSRGSDATALPQNETETRNGARWWRWGAFLVALAVAYALLGQAGGEASPLARAAYVALRALGALTFWFALVRPLLGAAVQKLLRRSRGRHAAEIERAMRLLPKLRPLAVRTWRETGAMDEPFRQRVERFAAVLVARTLLLPETKPEAKGASDVLDRAPKKETG